MLVLQAEGASHLSNGSWWRGKENSSISCFLLHISVNTVTPLPYKYLYFWGNGLWYNGWDLKKFYSYYIICYKFTCKDDVMFVCLFSVAAGTRTNNKDNSLSYRAQKYMRAFVLFAISKHLLLFLQVWRLDRTVIPQKFFQRFWQVLPWLSALPHIFLPVLVQLQE